MERRSLHDSSITVARSEEQPSESKSAKLRQSLRKSTLYAVPILIWAGRLQLAAKATTRQLLEQKKTWAWQPDELRRC